MAGGEETSTNHAPSQVMVFSVYLPPSLPSFYTVQHILVLGGYITSSNLTGERTASRVISYGSSIGAVLDDGPNSAQNASCPPPKREEEEEEEEEENDPSD